MEKDANQSRESKHFTGKWYQDQLAVGNPCKLPYSIVNKTRSAREELYKQWKRNQRKKLINRLVFAITVPVAITYLVITFIGNL